MTKHRNTSQEAHYLNISEKTLERWRFEGKGPTFRKFGKRVLYADDVTDAWAKKQERTSTSMRS